jgi:hypothetical protein
VFFGPFLKLVDASRHEEAWDAIIGMEHCLEGNALIPQRGGVMPSGARRGWATVTDSVLPRAQYVRWCGRRGARGESFEDVVRRLGLE